MEESQGTGNVSATAEGWRGLEKVQQHSEVILEEDMASDLMAVMGEAKSEMKKLPESSFKRMFWEQQVTDKYMHSNESLYVHIQCTCKCVFNSFHRTRLLLQTGQRA